MICEVKFNVFVSRYNIYEFQLEWGSDSEWGYKLITENISPKILTDYWDLRIILADYWWWISRNLTDYWELAKKFTGYWESTKKIDWFITENWVSPFKSSRIMFIVL